MSTVPECSKIRMLPGRSPVGQSYYIACSGHDARRVVPVRCGKSVCDAREGCYPPLEWLATAGETASRDTSHGGGTHALHPQACSDTLGDVLLHTLRLEGHRLAAGLARKSRTRHRGLPRRKIWCRDRVSARPAILDNSAGLDPRPAARFLGHDVPKQSTQSSAT